MADDEQPPRNRPWEFAKQKLIHPPPRLAAKPYPPLVPGGGTGQGPPMLPRPPAIDPARKKLEDGAALRREIHEKKVANGLEQLRQRHERAETTQREKFERDGASGIGRLPAEMELAGRHHSEVEQLQDWFQGQGEKMEASIETAFEKGYFSDSLSQAFDRAAHRETSLEIDGGRDRGNEG